MTPEWVCPRCGCHTTDVPARSRIDNNTKICSSCGLAEAIQQEAGIELTFETWKFPPLSVWEHTGFGDGIGTLGTHLQFLRFTKQCNVFVHVLDRGQDVSFGPAAILRKFYRKLDPKEARRVLSEYALSPTVNHGK